MLGAVRLARPLQSEPGLRDRLRGPLHLPQDLRPLIVQLQPLVRREILPPGARGFEEGEAPEGRPEPPPLARTPPEVAGARPAVGHPVDEFGREVLDLPGTDPDAQLPQ